jgi:hypothetical protein
VRPLSERFSKVRSEHRQRIDSSPAEQADDSLEESSGDEIEGMDDAVPYQPIRAIYVQDCRNCGEEVSLKASVCKVCQSGVSELQFKVCPICAEWIRKNAVRCRFCQQELQSS